MYLLGYIPPSLDRMWLQRLRDKKAQSGLVSSRQTQGAPLPKAKIHVGDPFPSPYDLTYVQTRIEALSDPDNRMDWPALVDQIRLCAQPRYGMQVSPDAQSLAKAKIKELSARNRRPR
jgi:hypothetical protein